MADLDSDFSARLARLAAAVPVAPGRLDVVHRDAVRARQQIRLAWLTPLVLITVGVVAASALRIGPFAPGATPQPSGPLTAATREGDFTLTIEATKSTYLEGEPIVVSASLAYEGGEDHVVIRHYSGADGGPVGFGIEEPIVGEWRLEPSWELGCEPVTLLRGKPLIVPFEKRTSPLFDAAPGDVTEFLVDPALHMPAGVWHVFATSSFQPVDCLDIRNPPDPVEMRVDLEITVLPGPAESPLPSDPVVDTDTEGPYTLELQAPRAVYMENEPIDLRGTFVYSGDRDVAARYFWPHTFSIREPVHGLTLLAEHVITTDWVPCPPIAVLRPGERYEGKFAVTGFSPSPPTEEQSAFLADPELRLPPGTWHLQVRAEVIGGGSCGVNATTAPPAADTKLEAEIEVVVLRAVEPSAPAVAEPSSSSEPSEPPIHPTPEPRPDGSPIDVDRDEAFELRIDPDSLVYRSDEPIVLNTSYTYLGPDLNVLVGHFAPEVAFSIEELDADGNIVGDISRSKVYDSSCTGRSLRSGIPVPIGIADQNLMGVRVSSLPGRFDSDLREGVLRLSPGRYNVRASMTMYLGGCRDGQPEPGRAHGLGVVVEIVVVPSTWSRIPILTASEPASACHLARHEGQIAPNADSGIGTAGTGDTTFSVRWPYGWSGWRNADGVVLLDATGRVVASEGDNVVMGGGIGVDVDFYACSGIEVAAPQ